MVPPLLIDPADDPLPDNGGPREAPTSQTIRLGYTSSETDLRRLAEVVQQSLEDQGWNVKLQADSVAAQFGYASDPTKAPEAAITTLNPDAAHPAAWLEPIYQTGGGINLLGFSDKSSTASSPTPRRRPTRASRRTSTRRRPKPPPAGYYATGVADRNDVFAARSDITGFTHVPVYIWVVKLADLERE